MKKILLTSLVLGLVFSPGILVKAQSNTTIQSCTTLLPSGRVLKLSMEARVDTSRAVLSNGSINLSSQDSINDGISDAEAADFIECVLPLVR